MVNPIADHVVTAEQALEAARRAVEKRRAGYETPGAVRTDTATSEPPKASEALPTPVPPAGASSHYSSLPTYYRMDRAQAAAVGQAKIRQIQDVVCEKMHVHRDDMLGPYRADEFVKPRHVSMALCKILTLRSLPEIGYYHGGRDHTTVMNALRKYNWLVDALRDMLARNHNATVETLVDYAILLTKDHRTWPKLTHSRRPT